ncbi:hypothetical protein IEU95_01795 [Hoyosella rhizosphaerae]|uniref:Uncharacterized protein n=1 Tax=Hoyosella rhizosphaerae TaxID=1755582 RepID=A0A916XGB8_9ACTN|nr:hypothetical protein [Hoyosella rhizosphaerae]MBN4925548.1 hypothetical protein [Hoyosella rhizosphaerae]GGC69802.1 hypothetical protein GCM10011410_23280 [Hoyosella rhizosphaerae]
MRAQKLAPAVMLTIAAVLAGCGQNTITGDEAKAESTAVSPASVDESLLDAGDYVTSARGTFGTVGDEFLGRSVEGQRLAEYVVLPTEIDDELTVGAAMSTYVIKDGNSLGTLLTGSVPEIAQQHNMLTGFSTSRSTEDDSKSTVHAVLRFPDATVAQSAAQQMNHNLLTEDPFGLGLPKSNSISGLPGTLISSTEDDVAFSANAFTAFQDYVLYTWIKVNPVHKQWAADFLLDLTEAQKTLVAQFPATPAGEFANIQMDVDEVLRYAVPRTEGLQTSEQAIYGPRGWSHFAANPDGSLQRYQETGTTRIAVDATTVYLSDTPEGSKKLFQRFSATFADHGLEPASAPPGLDGEVMCWWKPRGFALTYCLIQDGQFLAAAQDADETTAHQLATAQYLIFTNAK